MPPGPMKRTMRTRPARTPSGAREGDAAMRPLSRGEEAPGITTPAVKVSSSWGSSGDATGRILSDGLASCAGAHAHEQPTDGNFPASGLRAILPALRRGAVAQFGRAPEWHSGGRRVDPVQLHHKHNPVQ